MTLIGGSTLIRDSTEVGTLLDSMIKGSAIQSAISSEVSAHEHWESMSRAVELWLQSPVMGAGLGVFIEKNLVWFGHPLVVHSTPLWILAEFGMVGAAVFGWGFFIMASSAFKPDVKSSAHQALGLLLLCFAGFCLVHEIFYQRIFWLVLGAVLAYPGTKDGLFQEHKPQRIEALTQRQTSLFGSGLDAEAGLVSMEVEQGTAQRESSVLGRLALPKTDLQNIEQGSLVARELTVSAMGRSDASTRNRR